MRGWKAGVLIAVALYVAAAAQQSLAHWTLLGLSLDYLLLALSVACLYVQPVPGAVIGFADGFLHASISGTNMWQHVLTRTLVGYAVSRLASSGIDRNWLAALLSGIAVVLLARVGFLFLAPPSQIAPFLGDTLGTAVYNGVIAIPLCVCLNRIVGPRL